jgi:tRNA(Arg) A34 adenosine deaminase TadA
MSTSEADEAHIRRAVALAREAADRGDNPFGSVLVVDSEIVAEARNAVHTTDDVTAHPEHDLAKVAARDLGPAAGEATLYTSTEPCPMCTGALYHAGVGRVVYSAGVEDVRELVGPGLLIPCAELFARGEREVTVEGPILPEIGRAVHEECW